MPKILLVEDHEMSRDMLSRRLARHGYEVVLALDGAQGVALCEQTLPDLVIMDLGLPVMDGWEASRRIKAAPATRHIPIIALTARTMTDEAERARAAGCDDFEVKPVEFDRLLVKLVALLKPSPASPVRATSQEPPPGSRLRLPVDPEALRALRHDLRTPINPVLGYCELILEETDSAAPALFRAEIKQLHAAGRRMLQLTNELLSDKPSPLHQLTYREVLRQFRVTAQEAADLGAQLERQARAAALPVAARDLRCIGVAAKRWLERIEGTLAEHCQ